MFAAKKQVDADIAAMVKKLEAERFAKIAEVMVSGYQTKKYNSAAIEKKLRQCEKDGYVPGAPVPKTMSGGAATGSAVNDGVETAGLVAEVSGIKDEPQDDEDIYEA